MLHLFQSNKMEMLAEQLVSFLHDYALPKGHIFEPEQILVQSPGMSQWLKIQIAESLGIAANIDFPLPSSFIWQLYRQNINDLPEQSAFTKPNMAWKIMAILPKFLHEPAFSNIQQYLTDNPELKLYQLAVKIADVYDQYLVYRPEWIMSWEEGNDTLEDLRHLSEEERHSWQGILWRSLVEYSESLGESPYHRANLHQTLIKALQQRNSHDDNNKPLMVFGISAMPIQQLEVLSALATTREVVIFWFNPSQHYWGDIVDDKTQAKVQLTEQAKAEVLDVGNPLLASWGKLGRDYQDMLLTIDVQLQDCFVDNQASNLLEYIQEDINQLSYRGSQQALSADELLSNGDAFPKYEISATDKSIQIHACHSKVRELEVLHDQLLQRFNQHPDWTPGDVIVMMPDVASYAPYIEGVFGAVDNELAIPYAISDQNYGQTSPLINSFITIMKLHQSRVPLSEVLSLLEVSAIQNKFDINLAEYELIQHWLTDAGIRWGWDAKDKERWALPHEAQNTWLFGLQRLLAGYAMYGDESFATQGGIIAPYEDIEGQQTVALGKCYLFIQVLQSALNICLAPEGLEKKIAQALALLDDLYLVDEEHQQELVNLRETIEGLTPHAKQYPNEVIQDVFVSELEQNIQQKGVGQRFLAGYVNFCTLMPMRSIPFKMVCLLGMNDRDYPRQSIPMGFDLMRSAPAKRGDRSRRLDDRYLFLEALLSAREQLYFSYQGFSQRDNQELSPSILLSELIEYCQHGYALAGQLDLEAKQTEQNIYQHLIIEHRLQPFHSDYFNQNINELYSFNKSAQKIALENVDTLTTSSSDSRPHFLASLSLRGTEDSKETAVNDLQPNEKLATEIDLDKLIQFFLSPAQGFFIHRWQSRFYPFAQESSDTEPFSFDGLGKYQINQHLVTAYVDLQKVESEETFKGAYQAQSQNLISRFRAQGLLPISTSGELMIEPLLHSSIKIGQKIVELTQGETAKDIDVTLMLNDSSVIGRVKQVCGHNLIMWRPGKVRAKDKIDLYLSWLVLCALNKIGSKGLAYFVNKEKTYELPYVDSIKAKELLEVWVMSFENGHQHVLAFYPEASYQWAKTQDKNKTLAAFNGNSFGSIKVKGDIDDPHIQRVCPDLNVDFERFSALSLSLFAPLIELEAQA